jgi:Na+/H+ antiporter NhaD/arsenite permease-like protein
MLDLTGILQSAAFWVSNRGGTSGRRLFLYFYLMTTGLSAVLGNDPVILSGTAFLIYFTKVAEVSPIAWLFSEFASCNTASMLLFVGTIPPLHDKVDRRKPNKCGGL